MSRFSRSQHELQPKTTIMFFPLKSASFMLFLVAQTSARPSFPKRNAKRGGKSWRRNEPSVKLLKVLSNLERASWTEWGSGGTGRLVRRSKWTSVAFHGRKGPEERKQNNRFNSKQRRLLLPVSDFWGWILCLIK